jgi:hypothetical protein
MGSYKKHLAIASALSFIAFGTTSTFADAVLTHIDPKNPKVPAPWFTGPLLAPSGHTIPPGHVNIEPYVFFTVTTGTYNSHWHSHSAPNFYSTNLQIPIQVGLAPRLDFQFVPQAFYNVKQGEHSTQFGDMPFAFDVQLLQDTPGTWQPAIKLSLWVNFPFGKYKHLNPHKNGTDGVGSGSWLPGVSLVFSRLFNTSQDHFFAPRLAFSYYVPYVVYVKGYNVYGGGDGTKGKAYPGNTFSVDFGFEYNLNQRWGIAMDAVYSHKNKTRFSGKVGESAPGVPASVGGPSSEQFSLAPALEYNWNINVGLIGGVWFTVAGRNAGQFTSGVLALNIYI